MIGEKAVRTSARFIWLAAEFSPCRITSVVTGSASTAAPVDAPTPARVTTTSSFKRVDLDVPRRVGEVGPHAEPIRSGAVCHDVGLQRDRRVGDEAAVAEEISLACPRELGRHAPEVVSVEAVADPPLPR